MTTLSVPSDHGLTRADMATSPDYKKLSFIKCCHNIHQKLECKRKSKVAFVQLVTTEFVKPRPTECRIVVYTPPAKVAGSMKLARQQ